MNIMEENIIIDFHAHILPGMDDGSYDLAMSLAQLKMAAGQNISIVIATPHFYPHLENVEDFLKRREEAWKSLSAVRDNVNPIIKLGAEVLLSSNIDKMKGIDELCVESSDLILIEMPYIRKWEPNLFETLVRLRDRNKFEVILAHGERYPAMEIRKLLDIGFKVQLNVASTARIFPSNFIRRCMKEDLVAALGSDIHGLKNNYRYFSRTIRKWDKQAIHILENTHQILKKNKSIEKNSDIREIRGEEMVNVSVIIPVYNTEKYLRRCIDSLVNQTLQEIEILLVDDGSTDQSLSIIQEYENKYPSKVRTYTKGNGGQATARNLGIKLSRGKYIGFVDSDDYVDNRMYETMYRVAEENQSDMVECHYRYICEEGKKTKEYRARGHLRQYKNQKDMFINAQVSPCNKLFRREVLMHDGVDFPEGYIYEDTAFYIKAIPYIKKATYIQEKFYYYILRGNSTMNSNRSRRVGNILPVIVDILDFYKKNNLYSTYQRELEYFCVKILLCSSLARIGRIKDQSIAKDLYKDTFTFIRDHFPRYRQNQYLQGKIGAYLKCVRPWNCRLAGKSLAYLLKG